MSENDTPCEGRQKTITTTASETSIDHLRQIGNFIYEFSQLEFQLRFTYGQFFSEWEDAIYSLEHVDTLKVAEALDKLAKKKWGNELYSKWNRIFSEYKSINEERIRIVHGTWAVDVYGGFSVRRSSRSGKSPEWHYERSDDIRALAQKCSCTMSRLAELLFRND